MLVNIVCRFLVTDRQTRGRNVGEQSRSRRQLKSAGSEIPLQEKMQAVRKKALSDGDSRVMPQSLAEDPIFFHLLML